MSFDLLTPNHIFCRISQGHFPYTNSLNTLGSFVFELSSRQTCIQTDAADRYTPATTVGGSNYFAENWKQIEMYHINTFIYVSAAHDLLRSSKLQHSVTVVKYCSHYIKLRLMLCMMLEVARWGECPTSSKMEGGLSMEKLSWENVRESVWIQLASI